MPVADLTEEELVRWGAEFASALRWPAVVALHGDLGAGKTTLVRAIVGALGATEPVTSPTFALVHEYATPSGPVTHLDLYRIEGPAQLPPLGWEEMMRSSGLVLIEWPERAGAALPPDATHLTLEHVPQRRDVRRLRW